MSEAPYIDALLRDLDLEQTLAAGRAIETIYIGGGTPSLFSGGAILRLLEGIRGRVDIAADAEVTLEANPGAAEADRFAAYRAAGVNRLSIGVQSFRDVPLAALGRVHSGAAAVEAAKAARSAGFENFNIDLMYGLPHDSLEGALADLASAIDLGPTHLSWYQLTLEPGTAFYRRPPALPDEETVLDIEAKGRALLAAADFERYEVSAYARPGRRCRHNLNYWRFGDYLGIGAGAHGKLTGPGGEIVRRAKTRNPRTYMDVAGSSASVHIERVAAPGAVVLEFMMNALRLPGGIPAALFEARTGQSVEAIREPLSTAIARGWMRVDATMLSITAQGLEVLNEVLALFVDSRTAGPARPESSWI